MMQQVNLMGSPPNPIDQVLSVRSLSAVVSTMVVGMVMLTGFIVVQADAVAREVASIELRQQSSVQALAEFVRQNPERTPSRLLRKELNEQAQSLESLRRLINTLSSSNNENRVGFSLYMEGFAQQRVSNLWLTGFEISAGGQFMRISGNAMEPKSVPGFLKRLSNESIFSGRQFSDLKMSRSDEPKVSWVSFSVQTKLVEHEE